MDFTVKHYQVSTLIIALTLRQCSVSVLENILNLANSPMNLTVLFLVSMLIWSFFLICKTHKHSLWCIWTHPASKMEEFECKWRRQSRDALWQGLFQDAAYVGYSELMRNTHMKSEISFEHRAEVLRHVRHARVQRGHQTGVKRQQIQPESQKHLIRSLNASSVHSYRRAEKHTSVWALWRERGPASCDWTWCSCSCRSP